VFDMKYELVTLERVIAKKIRRENSGHL